VSAIAFLLPVAIGIAAVFLGFFLWAARSGQFDDLDDRPGGPSGTTEGAGLTSPWPPPSEAVDLACPSLRARVLSEPLTKLGRQPALPESLETPRSPGDVAMKESCSHELGAHVLVDDDQRVRSDPEQRLAARTDEHDQTIGSVEALLRDLPMFDLVPRGVSIRLHPGGDFTPLTLRGARDSCRRDR
jgi:cbb3-type cytochrome oxidase maturation protein